jgi:hypothetical protein
LKTAFLLNTILPKKNAIKFALWWFYFNKTENNSDFALFSLEDPKVKLRFEVLFNKFHPRIYLTTLSLTKLYLLNTIRKGCSKTYFSDHSNWKIHALPFGSNFQQFFVSIFKALFCLPKESSIDITIFRRIDNWVMRLPIIILIHYCRRCCCCCCWVKVFTHHGQPNNLVPKYTRKQQKRFLKRNWGYVRLSYLIIVYCQ